MTVEIIKQKIATDDQWLERGILAIWKYQTANEKALNTTNRHNNVGFNATDGHFLTSLGGLLNKGYHLSDKQKYVARKKMAKYAAQLLRIAENKNGDTPAEPVKANPADNSWARAAAVVYRRPSLRPFRNNNGGWKRSWNG